MPLAGEPSISVIVPAAAICFSLFSIWDTINGWPADGSSPNSSRLEFRGDSTFRFYTKSFYKVDLVNDVDGQNSNPGEIDYALLSGIFPSSLNGDSVEVKHNDGMVNFKQDLNNTLFLKDQSLAGDVWINYKIDTTKLSQSKSVFLSLNSTQMLDIRRGYKLATISFIFDNLGVRDTFNFELNYETHLRNAFTTPYGANIYDVVDANSFEISSPPNGTQYLDGLKIDIPSSYQNMKLINILINADFVYDSFEYSGLMHYNYGGLRIHAISIE